MSKSGNLHILLQRVTQLKNDCAEIIRDEKPVVPKWLLEQMARMHTGFFITDYPQAYTTNSHEAQRFKHMSRADRAEYTRKTKGLFPVHTMTRALVDESEHLEKKLYAHSLRNVRLMGADVAARAIHFEAIPAYHQADVFMLGKSDFFGLHQFAAAVEKRLKGEDPDAHKPLILHNFEGYWNPAIAGLDLDRESLRLLECKNIYMASRLSRVEAICKKCAIDMEVPSQDVPPLLTITPGATILVATRQNRKIHELQRIFDALGANIRVLPFHIVVGRPREAEDASGTYAGNNIEKMDEVKKKLASIPQHILDQRLKRHNIKFDENTFVLCDDRGEEFATNFFAEPEFAVLRKQLNPNKRGLGVEMANFLRAVASAEDMYHLIEKVALRLEAEGKNPSRDAYDYACYAIAPLKDLDRVMVMTATTEDVIVSNPHYDTKIGYSEDFLGLKNDPQKRSKNQTPNFMTRHSAMALSVAGIAKVTGLDAFRDVGPFLPSVGNHFAANAYDNRQNRWKIGMPQSASLTGSIGKSASSLRVINQGFRRDFALVAGSDDYDLGLEHTYTVMMEDGTKVPWYSSLVSADRYAKDMDAFYFRPIGPAKDMMEEFARDFSFFTPIVGKQTFGPHYHSKPNVVDARYARRQIENYDYLHKLGMIGDAPVYVRHDVYSKSEAHRIIAKELKHYVRPNDVDVPYSEEGEVPEGLFRIVTYASASNRSEGINAEAKRFGYLKAKHGFHAINGGGNDGLMRSDADGVIQYRQEEREARPADVVVNALTSIQCVDTIESEGEYPHADRKERHPTIFHRMDNLQKNDAEVFLGGGAGTLQEFYATCMDRLRTGRIENRPLILVNQIIKSGDEAFRVWDKLISTLPKGAMAACNIHVVNTVEEAMDLCIEARAKRGMGMKMKPNPAITANDNSYGVAASAPDLKLIHG